ncbi:hypothetical protein [Paenibacillus piri]|nr:hypothetical protein [Paenibacillus piri]
MKAILQYGMGSFRWQCLLQRRSLNGSSGWAAGEADTNRKADEIMWEIY